MKWILFVMAAVVLASGCTGTSTEPTPDDQNQDVNNENPDADTSTPADGGGDTDDENRIVFTGSGFQPSDITIEQGETVTFVDEADNTMWVASDRHPNHRDYAGTTRTAHCENGDQTEAAFDQCSTGDRFSFTFEKTGEWGYHNHKPYVGGGTITVE